MFPTTHAIPSDKFSSVFSQQFYPTTNTVGSYDVRPVANYSATYQSNPGALAPTNNHMKATGNFRSFNDSNSAQKLQFTSAQNQSPLLASRSISHAANNPVSDLFDRMYQSSMLDNSASNNFPAKTFEISESRNCPVGSNESASCNRSLRSYSSQGDLNHIRNDARQINFGLGVVQDFPRSSDYDNVNFCQNPSTDHMGGHPRRLPGTDLKFQAVKNFSNKDAVLPTFSLASDNGSYRKESLSGSYPKSLSPLDLDSGIDQDFTESEEPLPCDRKLDQVSLLNDGKSSYSSNTALPRLQNLKDLQLTVFMREAGSENSLDTGASKLANKSFQRQPGEFRTGSMPYRVKDTGVFMVQKSISPTEATGVNYKPKSFENQKAFSEATKLPEEIAKDAFSVLPNKETSRSSPVYDGPRLIPVEKLRDSGDSGSLSHSTSDTNDKTNAKRLAKRLYDLDGFRKSDVARHLGKRSDFAQLVRTAYLQHFDFSSMALDVALRNFLTHLVLSGETQERERILAEFSLRFVECNPHLFGSQDSCHMLVCGIMLLNTDLHGENGRKRMTVHEFVENLSGLNGGANFPKDLLRNIYNSIKNEPIEFLTDEVDGNPDSSKDELSVQSHGNPFLDVPDPSKAHEFKTGYLMRKCCIESDGRLTPMGKRGWKKFRASLRDLVLYLHKDEHGFSCGANFDDTSNVVRVHHSLAMDASDYAKRQNVFRLRAADWSEYLFQASDERECQAWIDAINQVAAAFSAPPLPGAVGSQMKFQRPLMPSACTNLSLKDQLTQHQQTLVQIEKDLADHRAFCPEKGSRPRVIQDYLDKETYLEFEQRRFQTYRVAIEKLISSSADPNKPLTNDGYFQRTRSSQASGHSPKKMKDASGNPEAEKDNRNLSPGIAQTSPISHYHGLHPAKSVPALLFESRV